MLASFSKQPPCTSSTSFEFATFLETSKRCLTKQFRFLPGESAGKEFCSKIVSLYANKLHDNKHPLFAEEHKFTNTSLRKFHTEKLANAGAPLLIQQQSLAQNTRFYTRGAHDMATKQKVAAIVAGEKKTWHSPDNTKQKSLINIIQLPLIHSTHRFSLLPLNRPLQQTPKNSSSLFRLRMPTSNSSMMFNNCVFVCDMRCIHIFRCIPIL